MIDVKHLFGNKYQNIIFYENYNILYKIIFNDQLINLYKLSFLI